MARRVKKAIRLKDVVEAGIAAMVVADGGRPGPRKDYICVEWDAAVGQLPEGLTAAQIISVFEDAASTVDVWHGLCWLDCRAMDAGLQDPHTAEAFIRDELTPARLEEVVCQIAHKLGVKPR